VINLLAYALVIDTLITPKIPEVVRMDYMIALLGQRFMGREVYSRTSLRYRSRREKTGVIRYGPDGPQELTRLVEEEVQSWSRIFGRSFKWIFCLRAARILAANQ
jgi:hypothetical protein